jgi:transposase, IS5 family
MEKLTGVEARRIHVDKGYRGHNHPHRLRVWISGQVRRVTASIRREMKRRAAVEPVIGLRWLAELLRAIIRAFAETVPAQKIA